MIINIPTYFYVNINSAAITHNNIVADLYFWNISSIIDGTEIFSKEPDGYDISVGSYISIIDDTEEIILQQNGETYKLITANFNALKHDELLNILQAIISGCMIEIDNEPFVIYDIDYNRIIGKPDIYKVRLKLSYYKCFSIVSDTGNLLSGYLINKATLLKQPTPKIISRFWHTNTITEQTKCQRYLVFNQTARNQTSIYGDLKYAKNILKFVQPIEQYIYYDDSYVKQIPISSEQY